ncbi:MAG: family 16 glycoside hydrolase [Verrucomicrobiota bacterium]
MKFVSAILVLLGFSFLPASAEPGSLSLFDGESLGNWTAIRFGGEGEVSIEEGAIRLDQGEPLTGIVWQGELPSTENYEISLDAKKINGDDFFLALTLPHEDSHFTFIVGGWGGGLIGISSLDGMDASENETGTVGYFEKGKWFHIRVRLEEGWLTCWIDGEEVVDLGLDGIDVGLRPGDIELCAPLGMASFQTWAAYKNIVWRTLEN